MGGNTVILANYHLIQYGSMAKNDTRSNIETGQEY